MLLRSRSRSSPPVLRPGTACSTRRRVRDEERGELTGNVIFLAALAVAAAAVADHHRQAELERRQGPG